MAGGREGGQAPILGGRRKRRRRRSTHLRRRRSRRRRRRRRRGTHLRSRRPSTRRPRPSCSPLPNIPAAPPFHAPDISSSDKTMSSLPRDVAFAWKRRVLVTALWRKCLFEGHSPSLPSSHSLPVLPLQTATSDVGGPGGREDHYRSWSW